MLAVAPVVLEAQPTFANRGWDVSVRGRSTTAVSGTNGPAEILEGPPNSVLTRIEFFERADRPCQVRATFVTWRADAQGDPTGVSSTFDSFDGCDGTSSSRKVIDLGPGEGIWGLRVCQRRQNDRLKGLEAKRAVLRPENGYSAGVDRGRTSFERSNCNAWEPDFVECAQGVARGLRIAHRSNPVEITGLALECGRVEYTRQTVAAPVRGARGARPTGGSATYSWSSPQWSGVSGETAPNSSVEQVGSGSALKAMSIIEYGDRPSFVVARSDRLCTEVCPDGGEISLKGLGSSNWRFAPEGQRLEVSLNDDHYITSIQICTSGQDDRTQRRIKGIRITGARLGPNGQLLGSPTTDEAERGNCSQWYPALQCSAGRVVVGLRGYYDDRRNNPFYTGLAVLCGRVEIERTSGIEAVTTRSAGSYSDQPFMGMTAEKTSRA